MKKISYLILGHACLILGILGAFLPILPTTPFLLLAAYLYSKSSPRLHSWLLNHKYFGSTLRDWHEQGIIGMKSKIIATLMILLVLFFRFPTLKLNIGILFFASSILIGVIIFIWSKPSNANENENKKI